MNKFSKAKNISELNIIIAEEMSSVFISYVEEHGIEALMDLIKEIGKNKEQIANSIVAIKENNFERWQEALIVINDPELEIWNLPGMEGASEKAMELLNDEEGMRDFFEEARKIDAEDIEQASKVLYNAVS